MFFNSPIYRKRCNTFCVLHRFLLFYAEAAVKFRYSRSFAGHTVQLPQALLSVYLQAWLLSRYKMQSFLLMNRQKYTTPQRLLFRLTLFRYQTTFCRFHDLCIRRIPVTYPKSYVNLPKLFSVRYPRQLYHCQLQDKYYNHYR